MNLNHYKLIKTYLGIIGAVIVIISEFLPWFSSTSILLFEYIGKISTAIEDAFLYLFPIISGGICVIAKMIYIYDERYKMKSIIINFVGLSFLLIFLFELVPSHFPYLLTNIGVYFCTTGLILIIIDIFLYSRT
ncbi:MAG: hypothetical protein EU547_00710 [Promethearchaeota archaeon]|nr:MAG: hypothetical protein EU547_00710 [Candidatus Lokiarchaeota archaeon]